MVFLICKIGFVLILLLVVIVSLILRNDFEQFSQNLDILCALPFFCSSFMLIFLARTVLNRLSTSVIVFS